MKKKKKEFNISKEDLRRLFKLFDIVRFNDEHSIPSPGKNIDILSQFSPFFTTKEGREEVEELKDSMIKNIWNIYFVFSLIYFFKIRHEANSIMFAVIVLIGFITIPIIYSFIHRFLQHLSENYEDLTTGLALIKLQDKVDIIFKRFGIVTKRGQNNLKKLQVFENKNKQYIILLPRINRGKLTTKEIGLFLSKHKKVDRIFIVIITETCFVGDVNTLLLENFDNLILIKFNDEKNLEEQLGNTIRNILS
jgi:hypothetical protein